MFGDNVPILARLVQGCVVCFILSSTWFKTLVASHFSANAVSEITVGTMKQKVVGY